ncbi:DsbA family protein [Streptomyces sp. HU2014]|uniref:Thioredoxin n=1 Tax=Streptomyces albireticuli TaxID=1940 RepID=A0A1Z2L4J9_9ACTN|nr:MULTISPECIES: DsbA family protein [Streptomyces]ARZ69233.1 thioredoxin [Streptomyces albireticuli]UQI49115.1 DsbA family protein [Streptomyces sp. HU2014]
MAQHRLTYAFDAYCGWCYGFGPTIREFAAANADRIELTVLNGGLFTGPRAQPVSAYPYIPQADARIGELTGAVFGEGYAKAFADGTAVLDSAGAATALVALRQQAPERTLEFAGALQRAWYVDGRPLSDPATLRAVAETAGGVDADAVVAAHADPATRRAAEADFREVRRLGVDSFPTLLLHTPGGVRRLGGPMSDARTLTRALDQH